MSVPPSCDDLIAFAKRINTLMETIDFGPPPRGINGPIIVHCSAGLGRAGTFILIHTALLYASENNLCFEDLKIVDILEKLRNQRAGMIQTKDQYVFAVRALKSQLRSSSNLSETQ